MRKYILKLANRTESRKCLHVIGLMSRSRLSHDVYFTSVPESLKNYHLFKNMKEHFGHISPKFDKSAYSVNLVEYWEFTQK